MVNTKKTEKFEEIFREALPMHFLFRIEAFSSLSKNGIDRYESSEFETGGYKWKLSLYPKGNKDENGGNGHMTHISMYLMLVGSTNSDLPECWELNVFFKLFVFDQLRDRYLVRGDREGIKPKRFHEMTKAWGFPQFLSFSKFNDPKEGYLVHDTCVFGAEVFVVKPPRNIECLSMVKISTTVSHTWKIENFSNIKMEYLYSEKFKTGDYYWNVLIYPKGHLHGKNKCLSLYLNLVDIKEKLGLKVCADFKLRIRNQNSNGKHKEFSADNHWFDASAIDWGWAKYIELHEMNSRGNGYILNDTCIVEAEVKVLGVASKRP